MERRPGVLLQGVEVSDHLKPCATAAAAVRRANMRSVAVADRRAAELRTMR